MNSSREALGEIDSQSHYRLWARFLRGLSGDYRAGWRMKIVEKYPPNIRAIKSMFALPVGVVFAYGDTIYNPSGEKLSEAIIAHEEVHQGQQGEDVKGWWERYLVDAHFRFHQELQAHRKEYQVMLAHAPSRNFRRLALSHIAHKLSAPMYGVGGAGLTTFKRARDLLRTAEQ